MLEPIEVLGRRIEVKLVRAPIRNSYARVRGDYLVIRLPERMSERNAMKTAQELHGRMARALQKAPERFLGMPRIRFNDKETIRILDDMISVNIMRADSRRTRIRMFNGSLYATAPQFQEEGRTDMRIRKFLERRYLPKLLTIVKRINDEHFGSELGPIALRDNLATWGSCSRDNRIILNFRLLYAPTSVLEYVIVHELAHTKVRNHSKRFWSAVASVIPDYKERRRWLRKNSHVLKPTNANYTGVWQICSESSAEHKKQ